MAAYAGSALYIQWIHSAGTAVLSGDYRTASVAPAVDLYDATAGGDTDRSYVKGVKNRTITVSYVDQADGTVTFDALVEGAVGTVVLYPEGTASGKPKRTYPAISQGAQWNQPYNDIVEITVNFQGNGAATYANA